MKLWLFILILVYIVSGIVPLITLFRGKFFEMENYYDYKNPYSVQWVFLNLIILFFLFFVWLCNKVIDLLLLIDWNLEIF